MPSYTDMFLGFGWTDRAGITAHLLVMFTLITGLIKSYKRRELNTPKLTLDASDVTVNLV